MVHGYELLRPLHYVLLLCAQGNEVLVSNHSWYSQGLSPSVPLGNYIMIKESFSKTHLKIIKNVAPCLPPFWHHLWRIKVPTGFAMTITSLQLLQMVVGCAINLAALNYKSRGSILTHFDWSDHVMFFPRGGMWCEPHQHYLESPHVLQLFPALCKVPRQQNNNTIFISSNWNTICKYQTTNMQIYNLQICKHANIQFAIMQVCNIQFAKMQIYNMQICPSRWTSYSAGFSSRPTSPAAAVKGILRLIKSRTDFNRWTSLFWK